MIMLKFSCNLLNTVLKVKNGVVAWVQSAVSVPTIYLCDHVADWGAMFTVIAQHHKKGLSYRSLAQEKTKIQRCNYDFYECILLSHHHKVKKTLG